MVTVAKAVFLLRLQVMPPAPSPPCTIPGGTPVHESGAVCDCAMRRKASLPQFGFRININGLPACVAALPHPRRVDHRQEVFPAAVVLSSAFFTQPGVLFILPEAGRTYHHRRLLPTHLAPNFRRIVPRQQNRLLSKILMATVRNPFLYLSISEGALCDERSGNSDDRHGGSAGSPTGGCPAP